MSIASNKSNGPWKWAACIAAVGVLAAGILNAVSRAAPPDATAPETKPSDVSRPETSKSAPDIAPTTAPVVAPATQAPAPANAAKTQPSGVPDSKHTGGEPDGVVQVANLIYAGFKSSHCFSDHFLIKAEKESAISTSRRFHAVKLASDEIYDFPMLIMTGEGTFQLTDAERHNMRRFIERGGFLLASASCSSREWDTAFRREMKLVFADKSLAPLAWDHPIFHTVYDIEEFNAKHGSVKPLEGITVGGRLGLIYSQDGLNDTAHTQGCCCCGGNEIRNAIEINVNILAYALTH